MAVNVHGDNSLYFKTGIDNSGLKRDTKKTKGILGNLKKWVAGLGIAATLMAGFAKFKEAVLDFYAAFEENMKKVSAISEEVANNFESYSEQITGMAAEVEASANDLSKTMYEIVAAGYDGEKAMKVLEASAKTATASMTDTKTAAATLTTALGGWNIEASKAKGTMDKLYTAVSNSKLTFDELNQDLGEMSAIAVPAGISLEGIVGSLTTMTETTRAETAMQKMTVALEKFAEQGDTTWTEQMTLQEKAMDVYEEAGGRYEKIVEKMGAEAAYYVNVIGSNWERAEKDMKRLNNAAGNMESGYSKAMESANRATNELATNIRNALVPLGKSLTNMWTDVAESVNSLFEDVDDRIEQMEREREEAKKIKDSMGALIEEYEYLSAKSNKTTEEQNKLQEVMGKITDKVPGAATEWSEYGKVLDVNIEKAKSFAEAQKNMLEKLRDKQIKEKADQLNGLKKEIESGQESMEKWRGEIEKYKGAWKNVEGWSKEVTQGQVEQAREQLTKWGEQLKPLQEERVKVEKELRKLKGEQIEELQTQINLQDEVNQKEEENQENIEYNIKQLEGRNASIKFEIERLEQKDKLSVKQSEHLDYYKKLHKIINKELDNQKSTLEKITGETKKQKENQQTILEVGKEMWKQDEKKMKVLGEVVELENKETDKQKIRKEVIQAISGEITKLDKISKSFSDSEAKRLKQVIEQWKNLYESISGVRVEIGKYERDSGKIREADVSRQKTDFGEKVDLGTTGIGKFDIEGVKESMEQNNKDTAEKQDDFNDHLEDINQQFYRLSDTVGEIDSELGRLVGAISNTISGITSTIGGIQQMKSKESSTGEQIAGGLQAFGGAMGIMTSLYSIMEQIPSKNDKIRKEINRSNQILNKQLEELQFQSGQAKAENWREVIKQAKKDRQEYRRTLEGLMGGEATKKEIKQNYEREKDLLNKLTWWDKHVSGVPNIGAREKFVEVYEGWKEVDEKIRANIEEYRQYMTGATADGLADGITQGLEEGKTYNEAFANNFEDLMKNAIMRSFKRKFLMKQLEPLMEFVTKKAEGGFTEKELEEIEKRANKAKRKGQEAWKVYDKLMEGIDFEGMAKKQEEEVGKVVGQMQKPAELTGPMGDLSDLEKESKETKEETQAMRGAIQEKVTEDTAGLIAGRMHSMQMHVAQHVDIANQSLETLRNIEQNTLYNKRMFELLNEGTIEIRSTGT